MHNIINVDSIFNTPEIKNIKRIGEIYDTEKVECLIIPDEYQKSLLAHEQMIENAYTVVGLICVLIILCLFIYYHNKSCDTINEYAKFNKLDWKQKEKVNSSLISPTIDWKQLEKTHNEIDWSESEKVNKLETYNDLLSTLDWKLFRERILMRDGYKCKYCGRKHNLQIHHKYYNKYPNDKHVKPWQYPDDAVITLCDVCHKKIHINKQIKCYYVKYNYVKSYKK